MEVSNFPENLSKSLPVVEFVEETAKLKAMEVAEKLKKDGVKKHSSFSFLNVKLILERI